MNPYVDSHKEEFSNAIAHFKQELTHIRSGQANPEMVDGIVVESYGTQMPMKQVATITAPDTKSLLIAPWDKSILKEVEKAIINANLGLTPVNDGENIRIPMPPMTEENRKDLVKLVNEKAEKARISIRQVRDKIKELILQAEKEKDITEDDKFRYLKQLEDATAEQVKEINDLAGAKSDKIMKL